MISATRLWKIALSIAVVWCATSTPCLSQSYHTDTNIEPGVLMVQYESGQYLAKSAYPSILQVQSMELAFPFLKNLSGDQIQLNSIQELLQVYRIRYEADISPHYAAKMTEELLGVAFAEPQFHYSPSSVPPLPIAEKHLASIPNDSLFSNSEISYMHRMQMTKAWDVVKGEDGNVVIAIVDTGVGWEHADLRDNLWKNPGEIPDNGIDDDENGFIDDVSGWDFSTDSNDPRPDAAWKSHGTAVAGAAVAVTNNEIGVAGTSWNAKFMPIGVLCGSDDLGLCYHNEGVLYAAMNGASIINASYGVPRFEPSITNDLIMQAALDLGSLVVTSAGNHGIKIGGYNRRDYPGTFQQTLNVCGTYPESYQNLWNYGYGIDVCSSGVVITTSWDNTYVLAPGTSVATPLVSGIAALVKTRFPEFTPLQIREQIRSTADKVIYDFNPPSYQGLLGRGYVNAYLAVTEIDKVSIRLVDWETDHDENNYCSHLSEETTITATFESFLADAPNVSVEFVAKSPHVVFPKGNTFTIGALQGGEKSFVRFSFTTTSDFSDPLLQIEPIVRTTDGEIVSGSDVIELYFIPDDQELAWHETATFRYSMSSYAKIGSTFSQLISKVCEPDKSNIQLKEGPTLFVQSGLLVGTGENSVAGSVLGMRGCEFSICPFRSQDFTPTSRLIYYSEDDGIQQSRVSLQISNSNLPEGIKIVQESLVNSGSEYENGALFRYRVMNHTAQSIQNVHVGLYFQSTSTGGIEYGEVTYQHNSTEETFPFFRDESLTNDELVGLAVLSENIPKHYRIYNSDEVSELVHPENAWTGLTGGVNKPPEANETGVSLIIGSGPYTLDAYSEVMVDFAMIYGTTQSNLVDAYSKMEELRNEQLVISAPTQLSVAEGDSVSFSVKLSGITQEDMTISMTGHEDSDLIIDPNRFTFLANQESIVQIITLKALEDNDTENDVIPLKLLSSGGTLDGLQKYVHVTITDNDLVDVTVEEHDLPPSMNLWENYPNPFSDRTTIKVDLPESTKISVVVTDLLGRVVKTLNFGEISGGYGHHLEITTGDLTSGVYYYTLRADMEGKLWEQSKAMTLVR
ncbi:MAG: S8 family serine peptidase [Bacteroidetes bacterium]|nr:S8 family serine peptidase [Bacteroidota bacterium]